MCSYSSLRYNGQDKTAEYNICPSVLQAQIIVVLSVLCCLEAWNIKKKKNPSQRGFKSGSQPDTTVSEVSRWKNQG